MSLADSSKRKCPSSRIVGILLCALVPCLVQQPAFAQPYPTKPVRIIVSSSAGSAPDLNARLLAQKMSALYGYTWVVENVAGVAGNLAAERVAKAVPDGYTLLISSAGPLFFNSLLYAKLAYDIQRDFDPITQTASTPNVLAVHPDLPIRSVADLVAYAKAHPGRLRFGSPGSGTSQHLSGELFKTMTGTDLQHVPYRSSSQMTTDLMSGQIEVSFQNAPVVLPLLKTGRLRAIAVTSSERLASVPDLPTVDEAGVAGYVVSGGGGWLAPRGTPGPILKKLEQDIRSVLALPDVREQYATNGWIPVGSSSADFAASIRNETARWAPIILAIGAKVD